MNILLPAPKHKLIGHRGVAGLRPENTYCSFAYAAELGLNWIEFDVQLTSDERWVVMHDADIARTTNGSGLVSRHTLADLQNLEAGLWFKPSYPDQRIPTLEGVLEQAKQLGLICNIEIKGSAADPAGHAAKLTECIDQTYSMDRVIVSSFDLATLTSLRHLLEDIAIAHLIDAFNPATLEITQQYDFNSINCSVNKITQDNLKAATAANIPIFLYTVNDSTTAQFWLDRGVAGLFTDRPDLLIH